MQFLVLNVSEVTLVAGQIVTTANIAMITFLG